MTDAQLPGLEQRRIHRVRPAARGGRAKDGTWTTENLHGPDAWRVSKWTGSIWQSFGPAYPTEQAARESREYRVEKSRRVHLHRPGIIVRLPSGLTITASWVETLVPLALVGLAAAVAARMLPPRS